MMKADLGWLQRLAGESAFVFRAGLKERLLAHLVCSLRLTSLGEYAHPTAFPLKFTLGTKRSPSVCIYYVSLVEGNPWRY